MVSSHLAKHARTTGQARDEPAVLVVGAGPARLLIAVDFGGLPTTHHYTPMLPQDEAEHLLRGAPHHQGGQILWGHEVAAGAIRAERNPRRPDALREVYAQDVCRVEGEIEALQKEEVSCPHLEA